MDANCLFAKTIWAFWWMPIPTKAWSTSALYFSSDFLSCSVRAATSSSSDSLYFLNSSSIFFLSVISRKISTLPFLTPKRSRIGEDTTFSCCSGSLNAMSSSATFVGVSNKYFIVASAFSGSSLPLETRENILRKSLPRRSCLLMPSMVSMDGLTSSILSFLSITMIPSSIASKIVPREALLYLIIA